MGKPADGERDGRGSCRHDELEPGAVENRTVAGRWREAALGIVLLAISLRLTACLAGHPADPPPAPDTNVARVEDVPRVASYELRAELDPVRHEVKGVGTLTFVNVAKKPLSELYVHLYLNAFANEKTRFLRKAASGFRGAGGPSRPGHIDVTAFRVREWGVDVWPENPTTDGDPDDRTDIRVPLPKTIAPGETIHVDMEFLSVLPSIVLRTGFSGSFHMVAQWFPKVATLAPDGSFAHFPFERFSEFFADFGDYDVTVSVPRDVVVGAVGERRETRVEGARRVERFVAGPVHDFSFAAWDGFEEADRDADGVAMRCLYPRGFATDARVELDTVEAALPRYGARYGAYPYKTLTIVHPPNDAIEAGGMEYPTLITTGGSFWAASSGSREIELLTIHELGHQWFYGLVASNEHDAPFLDEGVTTYATGQVAKDLYGDRPLTPFLPLSIAAGERLFGEGVASHAPIAAHADQFDTGSDYSRLVYQRAATAMRTIDGVYDGAFERALERYARAQRFRHPSPRDLIDAIRSEGGDAPASFAARAFLDEGSVRFVASIDTEGRGHVVREGTLETPVDVVSIDANGVEHATTWDGHEASYDVPSIGAPTEGLIVDPNGRILLDENLLDARATRRHAFSPRFATLALFLAEGGVGLYAP